ncbi:putative deoxyribonuclease tatdn3-A isoform X1 [Latimeria chalumnae]|uniref:putative deoxyribonuclease tatdn3-A isoform X1 n=1 Tax=Latimeria chalumnae TaxID=7897 RepID=UPI00313F3529
MTAEEFALDVGDVIARAKQAGVKTLVSVTEYETEFEKVIALSKRYPGYVMPCLGIHPIQRQQSATMQDLEPVLPLFEKYKEELVAIGEIGLDFTPWYAATAQHREEQQRVFRKQLELAKRFDLPVNVHSRSAGRQTVAFLKEQGIQKALLHNFAGRPSVAMEAVEAGYFFSFPPAVIRNDQRFKLIKQIPLDRICLETDSPALGTDKQERNEPQYIRVSCDYVAKVKGLAAEQVAEVTSHNALRLFPGILNGIKG